MLRGGGGIGLKVHTQMFNKAMHSKNIVIILRIAFTCLCTQNNLEIKF